MANRRRLWIGLLMGSVLIAVVLLAAGLSSVELSPGEPFYAILPRSNPASGIPFMQDNSMQAILRFLIAAVFVLTPVAVVFAILNPEARQRILRNALALSFGTAALYIILQRLGPIMEELKGAVDASPALGGEDAPPILSAPGFITSPPQWITTTLTALILLALFAVGWTIWRRTRPRSNGQLEMLALEAREAVQNLQQGADLKDTVMRCYVEMSRILSEERGIQRDEAMTPREFERHLHAAGLPPAPVERLTRLFETVRYGAQTADASEEQEAIHCLTAIAEACGRSA
jgi:hypothetical protein